MLRPALAVHSLCAFQPNPVHIRHVTVSCCQRRLKARCSEALQVCSSFKIKRIRLFCVAVTDSFSFDQALFLEETRRVHHRRPALGFLEHRCGAAKSQSEASFQAPVLPGPGRRLPSPACCRLMPTRRCGSGSLCPAVHSRLSQPLRRLQRSTKHRPQKHSTHLLMQRASQQLPNLLAVLFAGSLHHLHCNSSARSRCFAGSA